MKIFPRNALAKLDNHTKDLVSDGRWGLYQLRVPRPSGGVFWLRSDNTSYVLDGQGEILETLDLPPEDLEKPITFSNFPRGLTVSLDFPLHWAVEKGFVRAWMVKSPRVQGSVSWVEQKANLASDHFALLGPISDSIADVAVENVCFEIQRMLRFGPELQKHVEEYALSFLEPMLKTPLAYGGYMAVECQLIRLLEVYALSAGKDPRVVLEAQQLLPGNVPISDDPTHFEEKIRPWFSSLKAAVDKAPIQGWAQ